MAFTVLMAENESDEEKSEQWRKAQGANEQHREIKQVKVTERAQKRSKKFIQHGSKDTISETEERRHSVIVDE